MSITATAALLNGAAAILGIAACAAAAHYGNNRFHMSTASRNRALGAIIACTAVFTAASAAALLIITLN